MNESASGEPQMSENVGSERRPRMVSSGAAAAEAVTRATAETMSAANMILDSFLGKLSCFKFKVAELETLSRKNFDYSSSAWIQSHATLKTTRALFPGGLQYSTPLRSKL